MKYLNLNPDLMSWASNQTPKWRISVNWGSTSMTLNSAKQSLCIPLRDISVLFWNSNIHKKRKKRWTRELRQFSHDRIQIFHGVDWTNPWTQSITQFSTSHFIHFALTTEISLWFLKINTSRVACGAKEGCLIMLILVSGARCRWQSNWRHQ